MYDSQVNRYLDNVPLVYSIMHKLRNQYTQLSMEDLEEVCFAGYQIAVRTFDENKGYQFSTYATTVIKNEIQKHLYAQGAIKRQSNNAISLDTPIRSTFDTNLTYVDIINDGVSFDQDVNTKIYVDQLLTVLTPREKYILTYKYGLYDKTVYKYKPIAAMLNITHARVEQLHQEALNKIRNHYKAMQHSQYATYCSIKNELEKDDSLKVILPTKYTHKLKINGIHLAIGDDPEYLAQFKHKNITKYALYIEPKQPVRFILFYDDIPKETQYFTKNKYEVIRIVRTKAPTL